MKIIRIIVFVLLFYFVIPFDLYINSHHRIYYFGTDLIRSTFQIPTDPTQMNFTMNL